MGLSKNSYEKKSELDAYPYEHLLAVGVPDIKFYHTTRGLEALCPFHNDKALGSFSFNPTTGVWKCFSCGESGQGVISLIMKLNNWDFLKAVDYLYEHRNDAGAAFGKTIPAALKPKPGSKKAAQPVDDFYFEKSRFINHEPASEDDRHLIYQAFAAASPLSDAERNKLLHERRISYGASLDFFHMPDPMDKVFWEQFQVQLKLRDASPGRDRLYYSLIGVPGFYWDEEENHPSFVTHPGAIGMFLHSPAGKIVGIDMRRLDVGEKDARYVGFSSGSICIINPTRCTMGAKLKTYVDYVPRIGKANKGLAITEGKFKAVHLASRGYTTLNVRGVGNWRHVLELLKELPDKEPISIAFDADCRSNPAVASCASKLGHALLDAGYEVQYLTWSLKDGKGFDDLCINGHCNKCRAVPGEKFLETTLDPFLARAAKVKQMQKEKKRGDQASS